MASMTCFKVVIFFAVCCLATLSSGVGLIEDLKAVDENQNLRNSNNPVTIIVTETVCAFSSMTFSKTSTTIWIPAIPTMTTTTSIQTTVPTSDSASESSTTSSVEQTTSHRTASTTSSDASTPVSSSSEPPYAPPLSDIASGQWKIHFALLVWSLVMTGFMNV